jgi:hypothetical protein
MALRLGALQDALLDAGSSPEKAERAAEELADYEKRLASIDTRLAVLTAMVGTVIGLVLLVLGKVW